MDPIRKTPAFLIVILLATVSIAGCFGDGFGASGAPRAVVFVSGVGDDPYTFRFDATESSGSSLSYAWDFGDGTTASDAVVEHTYEYGDGMYKARLVVEDDAGTPDVWEDEIKVGTGENGAPRAFFSPGQRNYAVDEPVTVDASASFDPEGDPIKFRWDFNYLMDFDEYQAFRSDRAQALEGIEDDETLEVGGDTGNADGDGERQAGPTGPMGLAGPLFDEVRERDPTGILGDKHPPGAGDSDRIQRSLHSHFAETDEPVYTMEEGYPDTTIFFIRLQAYDIKGAHQELLSEEIWPVEVWRNPPPDRVEDSRSGNFTFGAVEPVTDLLDEYGSAGDEFIEYSFTWEFIIDWPIALPIRDGTSFTPGGRISLDWEAEVEVPVEGLQSAMEMTLVTPNNTTITGEEGGSGLRIELSGSNDYHGDQWEDPWVLQIIARNGFDLDWELSYWARLDTNPFGPMEEDYV